MHNDLLIEILFLLQFSLYCFIIIISLSFSSFIIFYFLICIFFVCGFVLGIIKQESLLYFCKRSFSSCLTGLVVWTWFQYSPGVISSFLAPTDYVLIIPDHIKTLISTFQKKKKKGKLQIRSLIFSEKLSSHLSIFLFFFLYPCIKWLYTHQCLVCPHNLYAFFFHFMRFFQRFFSTTFKFFSL